MLAAGCATDPKEAFPTSKYLVANSTGNRVSLDTLELGRKVFTTKCTECHVARSIKGYSTKRWRHYVGVMSPRAHLSLEEHAAVESYLVAARASLPQPMP